PPVFDLPQIGVPSVLRPHLLEPSIRLPPCHRGMRPQHEQTVAGIEVRRDLLLPQTFLVELLQQLALALITRIRRRQPARQLAGRWWNHLVPQPTRTLAHVTPELVESGNAGVATG